MKREYTIIIEVVTACLGLFVLNKSGVIGTESAVLAGIILIALIFCLQNLKQEFTEKIGKLQDEFKNLRDEFKNLRTEGINPIRNAIAEIQKFLKERFNFTPLHKINLIDKYGKSNSPMSPNDEGEKLLKESGFYNVYPALKPKIFFILDDMKTRTLYDAERNAQIALMQLTSDLLFDDIKNYAVNNPKEPLDTIFMVASWVIRADYAKEKGIEK